MNLIEAFRAMHTQYGALTSALDGMSIALGNDYDLARFGQWRRGERTVPTEVQAYLRRAVLTDFHRRHARQKFSAPMREELIAICETPPAREYLTTREKYALRVAELRHPQEQE